MCGRYAVLGDEEALKSAFQIEEFTVPIEAKFNIAPTQNIYAIIQSKSKRKLGHLRWGLIPNWAKDDTMAAKMINARSETVHEKPSFKKAFQRQRCIIPAIGYYEWKSSNGSKIPYFITFKDHRLFGFAGLWEKWINPLTNEVIFSTTILTTESSSLTKDIHHRMPVILEPNNYDLWLNPLSTNLDILFTPFESKDLTVYPVSSDVNKVSNNQSYLIEPENRLI